MSKIGWQIAGTLFEQTAPESARGGTIFSGGERLGGLRYFVDGLPAKRGAYVAAMVKARATANAA